MAKTTSTKKQREKLYKETSKKKFEDQRKLLIKPNAICFIVEALLYIVLVVKDGPSIVFDDSSMMFSLLLLINTVIPLIALAIIWFANKTTQLLIALSIHQLCIVPLIVGLFLKYEEMKLASAYDDLLIFYFIYFISYLVMTTLIFNVKGKLSTLEEK